MLTQVTISLPDGRSVALPVSEATRGAGVLAYTAALLGCAPDGLRLWPSGAGGMLKEADRIIPGTHFRAKLLTGEQQLAGGWVGASLQLNSSVRLALVRVGSREGTLLQQHCEALDAVQAHRQLHGSAAAGSRAAVTHVCPLFRLSCTQIRLECRSLSRR